MGKEQLSARAHYAVGANWCQQGDESVKSISQNR